MQDRYVAVEPDVVITISDLWCDAKKNGKTLARGNPDMGKFLQSCDGTQTIAEIVRAHIDSEVYFEESLEFAVYLTRELVGKGVLGLRDEAHQSQVRTAVRSTVSPGVVTLELTDACCLECTYCYKSSGPQRRRYLEQPLQLLSYLESIEVSGIELSGGEPLMHPEIDQILEVVCDRFDACSLLSNGILLREKHLEIMQGGKAKTQIQISLDGPDAETVDRAVGVPGSFERILSSIRLLKSYGMKFRIAMTINSVETIEKVEETLLLARSLGAGMFVPVLVLDFGRSEGNLLMRDKAVSQQFMETQLRLMDDYKDFFNPESGTIEINKYHNCGAGYRHLIIDEKRRVRFCSLQPYEDYRLSLADELLEDQAQERMKLFSQLMAPNLDTCEGCEFVEYCLACWARAMNLWKNGTVVPQDCAWFQKHEGTLNALEIGVG